MKRFAIVVSIVAFAVQVRAERGLLDIPVDGDRVRVQRCVLPSSPSKRMVAVGLPGGINYAFDATHCAPVYFWRGEFLDLSGEILGRGGKAGKILGTKQSLGIGQVPLRIGAADVEPESIRFRGYRRAADSGAPTFLFEVDGVVVEQQVAMNQVGELVATLRFGGGDREVDCYYHIDPQAHQTVVLSESVSWLRPGVIRIPASVEELTVTMQLRPSPKPFVRKKQTLSGEQIYKAYCSACHSLDGSKLIGPSFKDCLGSEREVVIRDGQAATITIDEGYIRESITDPQAAVVKGYELVPMADFTAALSDADIDRLVEYIKGL